MKGAEKRKKRPTAMKLNWMQISRTTTRGVKEVEELH